MTSISIEEAGPDDLDGIMRVMDAAFSPEYGEAWSISQCRSMLTIPGSHMFVTRSGVQICGFAFLRIILDEAELLMIAVHPDHARRGTGRALLEHVTSCCQTQGVKRLHLEVREDNHFAMRLYVSDNFGQIGLRPAYYRGVNGQTANSITFCKAL